MVKKTVVGPTHIINGPKPFRMFGIGFSELKFFVILFWMVKYCIKHWINPAALSRLSPDLPKGGKGQSSKYQNYEYITKDNVAAEKHFARCVFIPSSADWEKAKGEISKIRTSDRSSIVLKPDKGARSIGVKVTTEDAERKIILDARKNADYIAQEYVPYKHELGVYYYRYPDWKSGKILGIAEKKFDIILGDGKNTLHKLLEGMTINKPVWTQLVHTYGTLDYVPKKDEKIILTNVVSHDDQGEYYDRPDLITPDVTKAFNKILDSKRVYFCRFDVRVKSVEDFAKGKNFIILEMNAGPNAVLLHAFDPRYSTRKQLKICYEGYIEAFNIAKKLRHNPREHLIPYIWFLIKDELPLLILKFRMKKAERLLKKYHDS